MTIRSSLEITSSVRREEDCSSIWVTVEGKTRTVLEALTPAHLPALVVAPKRVAREVWPVEQQRWRPDLGIVHVAGTPADRATFLRYGADITVISRDTLADVLAKGMPRWSTLIIDELSGYKNWQTQRFKVAKKLVDSVDHVWGMTGTPTPNGYLDLWSQVYLMDHGARLGKNITTYRSRFFRPGRQLANGVITTWELREGADEKIQDLISDICMSMNDRIVLPEVTFNQVVVEMPKKIHDLYTKFKRTLVADLADVGLPPMGAANAAVLTNKLSQVSAGFLFEELHPNDEHVWLHNEKIEAAQEVVENTGSPVMIFYRFRPEARALKAALPQARFIDEPGVVRAWNAGEVPVLLAQPQSAGHGLNLQNGPGHTVLWTTMPWSLEEWEQANKRVVGRQGQQQAGMIHVLMCRDASVDYALWDRLQLKASVQDTLKKALESPL